MSFESVHPDVEGYAVVQSLVIILVVNNVSISVNEPENNPPITRNAN
jgi:hypothetical protein